MNMISTGAFQKEMGASNKQFNLAEKFAAVWEKKNAKAARAGGVSLMALSLAACGSDSTTTTTETTTETTTTVTPTVTPVSLALTTGTDTISGADLTSVGDTITATSATMAATDAVVDTRTGDGDAMNITLTAANTTATIANIETISFTWDSINAAVIDLSAVTAAETINFSSTKVGYLGGLTINSAKANTIVADTGASGTIAVNGVTAGTITADYGSTVGAVASTASGTHTATVNAATATTVTVTNFSTATVVAPAATAITVDDSGVSTANTHVTVDAAAVTFTNTNATGTVTVATAGDDATAATINAIGKGLVIEGEGNFTLNSTASAEIITNSKTSGTLTVVNSATTALDMDEVSADTIHLSGIKTAADTVASGANLKYSAGGSAIDVVVAGAGTADTATATLTAAANTSVSLSALETLNIVAAAPSIVGTDITISALNTDGNKVVMSGANDVVISSLVDGDGGGTTAGTVDASAVTGKFTVTATTTNETLTLSGGSAANTIGLSQTTADVTYTGGASTDAVTAAQTSGDLTVVAGAGANTVTTAATTGTLVTNGLGGVDTITAAALTTGTANVNSGGGADVILVGSSDTITTGKVTINSGDGNDTLTVGYGTIAAGTSTVVDMGAGNDGITLSSYTNATASSTLTIDGGAGTDTLTLDDNTVMTSGAITFSNLEVIQLAGTGDAGNANFQAADLSGATLTMKSDGGNDGNGFTVTGAASTTVIDLSSLTIDQTVTKGAFATAITAAAGSAGATITGTAVADTITGSASADTITAGNGIDTIFGTGGNDTIILTETTANSVQDNYSLALASTNGRDTVQGFTVGTDKIQIKDGATISSDATAVMTSISKALVTGASAYNISGSMLMAGASGHMISEIIITLSDNGDLDASNNGSELLKAVSTSATAAASQITVDSADHGFMLAYQDGNAYLYEFGTTDTTVVATNMTLVSVLEGVTATSLNTTDFVLIA
jgi:hypothetical protein